MAVPRRLGRPGTSARAKRACVEMNSAYGLRHRPGADHGGDDALAAYGSIISASLSRQAGERRMDGHDAATEPQAGPMSARCAPRPSAATAAIASPVRRPSPTASTISPTTSFTSCRAPARRAARHERHFAVPRAEVHVEQRRLLAARNDVRAHSVEHKMGIHARRPARWCMATTAAP